MFRLESLESIVGLVTIVVAYFLVVTISGWFRAWAAVQMGDDTPAHMGFLKVSPLRNIDPFGFISMILLGFGWGRYIPIMPFNITGQFRKLKIFVALFADFFANLALGIVSLISLILYFGADILRISVPMMFLNSLNISNSASIFDYIASLGFIKSIGFVKVTLETIYPASSSFAISMGMITIVTMYISVLFAALSFLMNSFSYCYMMFSGSSHPRRYSNILIILTPMILIFCLFGPLRYLVVKGIFSVGAMVTKMFGLY